MAARSFVVSAALVGTLVVASPAAADIFKLYAEGHVGGTVGKGIAGDRKDDAFFGRAAPPTYGVLLGGRFLIVEARLQHHQFLRLGGDADQSDLSTWTQFDLGLGFSLDLGGDPPKQKRVTQDDGGEETIDATDDTEGEKSGAFLEIGVNLGFGVGTGEQVQPPLSNDEITDKGFVAEARIGFGKHLNKYFDVGVQIPVAFGYFFKTGEGAAANDIDTHYRGLHGSVLVYLRANVKLL